MLVRRTNSLLDNVIDEWNRAIDDKATGPRRALALDVSENEDGYVIMADLPGMSVEDIDIQLDDNALTIGAETAFEEKDENTKYLVQERRYGKFSRSLRFPVQVNAEGIEANYNNGVLTVSVPKAEETKPRRITISGATSK